jgi:hypothetical protein
LYAPITEEISINNSACRGWQYHCAFFSPTSIFAGTAIQKEIHPHNFSYFVGEPPSVAQGGRGIVVPGRSARRKRFNTVSEFAEHLANDAMPGCAGSVSLCPECGGWHLTKQVEDNA